MKKFIITEDEKSRILGMHKTATSRHYLTEQVSGGTQESDPVKCLTKNGYTEVNTNNKGVTTYSKVGDIIEVYGTKDKKTWTYYKKNISGVVDQKSVKQNVDPCKQ